MAGAVPREKRDALAAQRPDHVRTGRIAEWRAHLSVFAVGQLGHVVQTAAAYDPNRRIHVVSVCSATRPTSLTCPTYLTCPACPASFSSISTPPVLAGCTNAIRECSAPGRGSSSINRTPRAFGCPAARWMSAPAAGGG